MSILTNKVGLSITEDKVQLVEISKKDSNYLLENVDEEYFEESLFSDTKEAKFIHILQNAFNELILRNPLHSNNISITIPPSFFKTFEIPADKNLTKNDLNDYIKWELSKLFPNNSSDHYTFQKTVLSNVDYRSSKKVLVHAVPINLLKRIHKFCARNNLILNLVDGAHTALSSLVNEEKTGKIKLSIYIENDHLSVMLFSDGNLLYEKSKKITNVQEITGIINSIIEEINLEKLIQKDIDQVYIFGNSATTELKNSIVSSNNFNLVEVNQFNRLSISAELQDHKFVKENHAKFLPATAIALRIGS